MKPDKIFLYNSHRLTIIIKDLDLKIKAGETIELFRHNKQMTFERFEKSLTSGSIANEIDSGRLFVGYDDQRVLPPPPPFLENVFVFERHSPLAPVSKQKNSDFIERLQVEFGDKILETPENQIDKTEYLEIKGV